MAICNPAHTARIRQGRLSVEAARAAGDPLRLAQALYHLADVLRQAGRWPDADAADQEARALHPTPDIASTS
jgi:hypothetical protein